MRKSTALSQSVAQEAAISAQQSVKDELKQVMEEQRLQLQREKDNFIIQVSEVMNLFTVKVHECMCFTPCIKHTEKVVLEYKYCIP